MIVPERSKNVPRNAKSLRLRSKNLYRMWWGAHYSIGFLGILSAALLTALNVPGGADPIDGLVPLVMLRPNAWLLGVLATICGSLITLLGPLQKAERYFAAFHLLDQAIMELEQGLIKMDVFARRTSDARKVLQLGAGELETTTIYGMIDEQVMPPNRPNKPMQTDDPSSRH